MTGMTGPVLDRDRLDVAADRLLAGTRIDVAAVRAASETRIRRARRRRLATTVGVLAAAAAVILAIFAGLAPGVLSQPRPADVPDGPGAVPTSVHVPPPWTPSATASPLSRVAYVVLDGRPHDTRLSGSGHPVWLVGADGGQYRYLPAEKPYRLAVSPDGAYVTWIDAIANDGLVGGLAPEADVLQILKVSTGTVSSVPLPGVAGRGFAVEGTAFAPAGHRLALWGRSRAGGGWRTSPEFLVVSVDREKPLAEHVCGCAPAGPSGFGVGPDGAPVQLTHFPLGGRPVAPVADGDGVPPGLPPGPITQPALLAPDGRTLYAVGGTQVTPRSATGLETYHYVLLVPKSPSVDLGVGTAAVGLGVGRRGAVVSLWTSTNGDEKAGTGPGAVLVVDGRAATTVTRTEDTARVIAAATAVLDGGRTAPAAEPGRLRDVHWWTWQGGRLAGWAGGVPLWALLPVALVGLAVAVRLAPVPRPGVRAMRVGADGVVALAVVAVAGAGVVMVAGELLGSPAAGSEPSGAAGARPVMPRVLRDQHREPPRAFDAAGVPVTRRVSAVFDATITGTERQYALDAATGRTVRLDELPGLPSSIPSDVMPYWTVSPNGRYLATNGAVLDLETARARSVTPIAHPFGLAVLNDGTVVHADEGGNLWVERTTGGARRVARYPATVVFRVDPGPGPYALVWLNAKIPAAAVVDVGTGKVTQTPLPVEDEQAPLAVNRAGQLVAADGELVATRLREHRSLMGAERRFGVSDAGYLVTLSPRPDTPGSPLEIRRRAALGDRPVTRLRFAPDWMQLATDVVAVAQPVDVAEPRWSVVADPDVRAPAAWVLGAGVLVVLLAGMSGAAVRRPRPYRRDRDEPPGEGPTPPTGPTGSPGPP